MRLPINFDEKVEIQMSPLIDCVFLLLIFFLVTTMMRKSEMQIPLSLPTMTSSLSTTRVLDNAIIIAIDDNKSVYQVINHDAYTGGSYYIPIQNLNYFLDNLKSEQGTGINIEIAAYRMVPVETVIEVFDRCQLQGFSQTRVRLGSKPY